MTAFIRPRLREPALTALAGAVFAAAWAVRGGPLWWVSIATGVATVVRVIVVYVRSGRDEDALVGSRPDERQRTVSLRSRALAGNVAVIVSFAGLAVAIAVRSDAWLPFLAVFLVTGFAYLYGLSTFGVGEEGPSDDADASPSARSSVSC
jgi:phosphatidylglycerophosphate synthase